MIILKNIKKVINEYIIYLLNKININFIDNFANIFLKFIFTNIDAHQLVKKYGTNLRITNGTRLLMENLFCL
jgi:hypothetical protein